jgi:DNA repair protein RecN (Recombination protein N)
MLIALEIKNFILIESLELVLEPGFNVITGETGAGKSIIIGALEAVLGGRARADMVRPGAKQAEIEALFDVRGSERIRAQLEASDIPCEGELVVRRVIYDGGRSRAYLNGRLCTLGEVSALALELADITSQHESVALADPGRHLDYLDRHARLLEARGGLGVIVDELGSVVARIADLVHKEKGRAEREGFLRYQLETIEKLRPQAGELEELDAELGRLKHGDRLSQITTKVAAGLDGAYAGADDESPGDALGRLVSELREAARLDPQLGVMADELDYCWGRLREVAREVARYAERLDADPARLDEVQERIFQLERLMRQHGPTLAAVLEAERRLAAELAELEGMHTALPALESQRGQLFDKAARMAKRLSKRRHQAAADLGEAISAQLAELGMGKARVVVDVTPAHCSAGSSAGSSSAGSSSAGSSTQGPRGELSVDGARLGRDGIDRVQFLIAPNRGMEPRPLGRIASGGELSRALLALKRALAQSDHAGSEAQCGIQILDEVDTGVGGETADRIGRAIADISRGRQVLCITHLAAIAAYGDAHFVVHKHDDEAATTSAITRIDGEARAAELARMLTGTRATKTSLAAARDLLQSLRPRAA